MLLLYEYHRQQFTVVAEG